MSDPSSYRPAPGSIPVNPGVYRFRDPEGRVVYVGKAINLRSRLNSYFQDFGALHARTQKMLTTASSVDWLSVGNEVEALVLEYSWIKEYSPRFNVRFRDDKTYPYLAVTVGEDYPRVAVVREAKKKGTRYFGPYTQVWAIKATLEELIRVFPVRSCRNGVFNQAKRSGRACLLGYIDKCSAPCVDRITIEDYRELVDQLMRFLSGQTREFVDNITDQMKDAAEREDYEAAATQRVNEAIHSILNEEIEEEQSMQYVPPEK
jgi:excinuclease ABC subunit C